MPLLLAARAYLKPKAARDGLKLRVPLPDVRG
jgi:hypothetical protein